MFGAIMLVVVTLFAVLGAYYLSDLAVEHLFRKPEPHRALVVLAAENMEGAWGSILDVRTRLRGTNIIVVCPTGSPTCQRLEENLRDIIFATPETVGDVVCDQLMVPVTAEKAEK